MDELEKWAIVSMAPEYEVSSFGRVRSKKRGILKQSVNSRYFRVWIGFDVKTHRLVATAFVENTLGKPFVNHIDSNTLNNHASNLEWVTTRENAIHHNLRKNRPLPTGVSMCQGKFRACFNIGKKNIKIGRFETAQEASKAYQEAIKSHP